MTASFWGAMSILAVRMIFDFGFVTFCATIRNAVFQYTYINCTITRRFLVAKL